MAAEASEQAAQNENDLPISSFRLRSGRTSEFHEERPKVLLKENGQP